ncbi:MAG: S1 RNA-binding domain-containing protein [Anaerolineaceae bacterium]
MNSSVESENDRSGEIKPKMQYTGTVLKTSLAGAKIDIGSGEPAYIHISQIQDAEGNPVKAVDDVLKAGEPINVWVRKIKDGRIELTMYRPLDMDWRDLKTEMVVKGKVTRLEKFGAFVEIGAERPGLIHISEMAHGYVRTPEDVLKEGDEVEAMIIDVNRKKKQIKLSLKALQPEPVKEEQPARSEPSEKKEKTAKRPKKPTRQRDSYGDFSGDLAAINDQGSAEPDPTAMEIAIREAMEKAKKRKAQDEKRKSKSVSNEQEDILSRTLENKAQTS